MIAESPGFSVPAEIRFLRRPAIQYYALGNSAYYKAGILASITARACLDLENVACHLKSRILIAVNWYSGLKDPRGIGYGSSIKQFVQFLYKTGLLSISKSELLPVQELDWSILPAELSFLAEPAEKYGHIRSHSAICKFEEEASDEDWATLRELRLRINAERLWGTIEAFWTEYPITVFDESAHVYFLLGDLLDLEPTSSQDCETRQSDTKSRAVQRGQVSNVSSAGSNRIALCEAGDSYILYDPTELPDPIERISALGDFFCNAKTPDHLGNWAYLMLWNRGTESLCDAKEYVAVLLKCCRMSPWDGFYSADLWYRAIDVALAWGIAPQRAWLLDQVDSYTEDSAEIAALARRLSIEIAIL